MTNEIILHPEVGMLLFGWSGVGWLMVLWLGEDIKHIWHSQFKFFNNIEYRQISSRQRSCQSLVYLWGSIDSLPWFCISAHNRSTCTTLLLHLLSGLSTCRGLECSKNPRCSKLPPPATPSPESSGWIQTPSKSKRKGSFCLNGPPRCIRWAP